jgi:hypothetical protein
MDRLFAFIAVEAAKPRRQKNTSYLLDLCRTHLHLLDSTLFYGYTFGITGFLVVILKLQLNGQLFSLSEKGKKVFIFLWLLLQ